MTLVVKLRDIVDELDMLSDGFQAFLNKYTGKLITLSREELAAAKAGDDLNAYSDWEPEAIQAAQAILNTDAYLLLPSTVEIHEYSIMERFCYAIEDTELRSELLRQIKGSGAFRRFKHTIDRHSLDQDWYRYRQQALEQIAIDWLNENRIEYEPGSG